MTERGTFAQALEAREPVTVVDPRDGTVQDLAEVQHEQLVDILLELQKREKAFKDWRIAVEDELVRRHGDKRHAETVGDHEIDVDRGYGRVWDAEELELVATDLLARDLLSRDDIMGLIGRVPKVDGRKAAALLSRVDGDALVELRRCFTWEQRGRAKVRVTPVASLEMDGDAP